MRCYLLGLVMLVGAVMALAQPCESVVTLDAALIPHLRGAPALDGLDVTLFDMMSRNVAASAQAKVSPIKLHVSCGNYVLEVNRFGTQRRQSYLKLPKGEVYIRIGLNPVFGHTIAYTRLEGKLDPEFGASEKLSVRIMALLSQETNRDYRIGRDYVFTADWLPAGPYIIAVLDETGAILATKPVTLTMPTERVDLIRNSK